MSITVDEIYGKSQYSSNSEGVEYENTNNLFKFNSVGVVKRRLHFRPAGRDGYPN
jgi:hypothetical protein